MAARSIENAAMDRLNKIVEMIPQVKPRLAMTALKTAVKNGTHGAGELDQSDRDLAWRDGWGQTTSPIGGRILVALFRDGKIAQHAVGLDDIAELEAYASGVDDFRAKIAMGIADWEKREQRLDEIAANPDCALPEEITSSLINEVFLRVCGLGHFGTMRIAGLECHKGYNGASLSNSGKTRYPGEVYCWWIDADGTRRGQKTPASVPNRRNDPARNWGLGRD
ncbi:MAG TPA: hypothetical protein PLI43_04900 [Albidovulum sp.]|uniref:hypothetical protein n=1 Tax=Albidovulum sp. TaxID=1872424 RepID=UPI002C6796E5|nr:hypothetical protein [Albidovulum sp.]